MGDPFFHYRTDDLYFSNIARLVKPGGPIGITGAGLMQEISDPFPDSWKFWRDWQEVVAPNNTPENQALEADCGQHLDYVRAIGHRCADATLEEPVTTIPAQYEMKPLLRPTE